MVRNSHTAFVVGTCAFCEASIASCVSSSSLPVRSMLAESTSASNNQSKVSSSSSCSLGAFFKSRRMEMTRKRGNTFEGRQESLEFENFKKIFNGLRGKLDAEALVIKGIADKKFEPKLNKKNFSNDSTIHKQARHAVGC